VAAGSQGVALGCIVTAFQAGRSAVGIPADFGIGISDFEFDGPRSSPKATEL